MKKMTLLSHIKFNPLVPWLLISMLFINACSQDSKDQSTSISFSLPSAALLNGAVNSTNVSGDLTGIASVVISVYDNNDGKKSTDKLIGSGDILAAGGTLSFKVLPYTSLYITGEALDSVKTLQLFGETTVSGLHPGDNTPIALSLQPGVALKPIIGTITTAGSLGTVQAGAVQAFKVVGTTETLIAQGSVDANGKYSITLPRGTNLGSDIIFRVAVGDGEGTVPMETRFTSANVDINPVTDTASKLLTYLVRSANADLGEVSVGEVLQIQHSLQGVEQAYDLSGATTLTDYTSQLQADFLSNLETANILTSAFSLGSICGHVQDSKKAALSGITIEVRDFHSETLRARTTTDASGNYCVSVPLKDVQDPVSAQTSDGEYLVGAINRTNTSFAASEWWTAAGNGYERIKGDKITVASEATISADFTLEPGARISGNIGATDATSGNPVVLPGVDVSVLDSITQFTLADQGTQADGSFVVNVYPGDYIVEARNSTFRPYASQTYTDQGGSNLRNNGTVLSLAAGDSTQVNFTLGSGYLLRVRVAVGADATGQGGVPVTGVKVLVNQSTNSYISAVNLEGASATRFRVINLDGTYRVWLVPDTYNVFTYGQQGYADLTAAGYDAIFADTVATLPVKVQYTTNNNTQSVSGAKLRLYAGIDGYYFWDGDVSRSDGSATLYSNFSGDHRVEVRVEEDKPYASVIYGGTQNISSGTSISLTPGTTANPITVDLPAGGMITGTVSDSNDEVVMLSGQGYFVATRTNSLGQYRLSLPESVYDPAQVNMPLYPDTCYNVDAGIPIITGVTTTMDASTSFGDSVYCDLTIPPLTLAANVPSGSVTFDRSYSHDTARHALVSIPTLAGWPMEGYDVTTGLANTATRTFSFAKKIVGGLPVTVATTTINGAPDETVALAVANDGALYAIANANAYLYLPATLNTKDTWDGINGDTYTVLSVPTDLLPSPAGYSGTYHIQTTYADGVTPAWDTYLLSGSGVVDESEESTPPVYYRRTDVPIQ